MILYINCIRGESFRSTLLQLGEIRSILPEKINVMALTATITQLVRMQLQKLLEMKDHVHCTQSMQAKYYLLCQ